MNQQPTREEVLVRVELFVARLTEFCNEYNINKAIYKVVFDVQVGKKNVKIVRREQWHGQDPQGGSAHCFIDIETGNILKAASFKVPAKGIRGSIFKEDFDIGHNSAVNIYGAAYLR